MDRPLPITEVSQIKAYVDGMLDAVDKASVHYADNTWYKGARWALETVLQRLEVKEL